MNCRTDLAFEASATLKSTHKEKKIYNNIKVIETIVDANLSKQINKKQGNYYLMDITSQNDEDVEQALILLIKKVLKKEKIKKKDKGLIVGLGNSNVTPDSLGPLVSNNVLVTRHFFTIDKSLVDKNMRNVCSFTPGVMGATGLETSDIIKSLINNIDFDFIIVIDALAASNITRINKTIQITNTGISPGSGVGNRRKEISKETLQKPVIAIGVPTVVDAATITNNTLEYVIKDFEEKYQKESHEIFGTLISLSSEEKKQLIKNILHSTGLNMIVTPKDVDQDIERLAKIISSALNQALHNLEN